MSPQERSEMRNAEDEKAADEAQAEADRQFGATMAAHIDAVYGSGAGRRFRDLVIKPTRPGTKEREDQTKAWSLLTARLSKLVGDQS